MVTTCYKSSFILTRSMHSLTKYPLLFEIIWIRYVISWEINSKLLFTLILSFENLIIFYYIRYDTIINTNNIMCYVTLTQIHTCVSKSVLEIKLDLETTVRDKNNWEKVNIAVESINHRSNRYLAFFKFD